ncbi:ester cyclase [Amycolatopsis rhizosphaerae]|nr:ester cyclase [Amycolatopsis rhizosphaerae]
MSIIALVVVRLYRRSRSGSALNTSIKEMTMDRRAVLRSGGAVALGVLALTAVESGTTPALAAGHDPSGAWVPLPDPADGGVVSPPYPKHLTAEERAHLETFDELDFVVFSHAEWSRLGESHAAHIRVHWPDGHYTDGIDQHIADLAAMFVWAPDTRINVHPLRVAKDNLTAVMGVMRGTFTKPMPDGKGGFVAPTGKSYAINMCTVGIWNRQGTMDEEFLFWDNQTFYSQIGLA